MVVFWAGSADVVQQADADAGADTVDDALFRRCWWCKLKILTVLSRVWRGKIRSGNEEMAQERPCEMGNVVDGIHKAHTEQVEG